MRAGEYYDGRLYSLLFTPDIGMLVTSGRAVTTFNPETGEFTLVSRQGHAEDVCATLAP